MTPRIAGTALGMSAILGLASTLTMMLFGRVFYAMLGATGPALEAAVLYSEILFLGAVPFWLDNAAASVLRGGGNTAYPAPWARPLACLLWRLPRSSSSERARSPGSASPGRPGPSSATTL